MGSVYDTLHNMENKVDSRLIEDLFGKKLSESTIAQRWLTSFVFELTPVCNFACKMCYIRMSPEELESSGHKLLRFEVWKNFIDQLCEIGAYSCTLTGGECTTHPDFCKIYEYAYSKGLCLTVMTNGSNITDEIFEMFTKYPPSYIYITIYGSSEDTYRELCDNAAGFKKAYDNVERLVNAKMPVVLQFTSTKYNQHELMDVYEFSKKLGISLRHSDLLIDLNKSNDETINLHKDDEEEFKRISKYIWCDRRGESPEDQTKNPVDEIFLPTNNPIIEKGIPCNAGRNSCTINWKGEMLPCVVLDAHKEYPLEKSIKECWGNTVAWSDNVPRLTECQNCIFRLRCKQCIAQHYGDTGVFGKPSDRLCFKKQYPKEAAEFEARYNEFTKAAESE